MQQRVTRKGFFCHLSFFETSVTISERAIKVKMERKIQEPKASVIVPMYKCESFAEDCLDMICGQTFSDIEIICVLDGPDAKAREIVESKQKEDDRIILIEQDHAGAGAARNTGLDRARGEYLFVFGRGRLL